MKRLALPSIVLALVSVLAACASSSYADRPAGGTYYTQFALHHEKNRFRTTNYRRGILLPINSQVTLVDMNSKRIKVRVESTGQELLVENMPKHTSEAIDAAFDKIFADAPVDLDQFTADEQDAIARGQAEAGMRRDAVIAALGYPPAVGTPTLESKQWKYWSSRFTTFLVTFDDDWHVVDAGR